MFQQSTITNLANATVENLAELQKTFKERGYAGPFTLCEPDEMTPFWKRTRLALFDRSKAVYDGTAGGTGAVNIANYDRHLDNAFLADLVCHPMIVERVCAVLGPDVLCWRTEFFPKYPGDEGTDWHQEDTFGNGSGQPQLVWSEDREFGGTISIWTAFTDADEETGCMRFIPGTHRAMHYDEERKMHYDSRVIRDGSSRGVFGYSYKEIQKDPTWSPDDSLSVSVPVRAGQFIMFWSTLAHASRPHLGKSNTPRIAFTSRYVPTSVRIYPNMNSISEWGGSISLDKYGAVLIAGRDRYGYNRLVSQTTAGKPFAVYR